MAGDQARQGRASKPRPWRDTQAEDAGMEQGLLLEMVRAAVAAPVEPPPGAEERVRRRLEAQPRPGRRWLLVAMAALPVVVLLVLALTSVLSGPGRPPRTLLTGIAVVRGRAEVAGARVRPGDRLGALNEGEQLRSSAGTLISAELSGAGRMIVHASTTVSLPPGRQTPESLALLVHHGEVVLHVEPGSGRQVVIETRDASVRVTGTVFAVSAGEQHTRVSVWRGSVEVDCGPVRKRIEAGGRLTTEDRLAVLRPPRDLGVEEKRLLGIPEAGRLRPAAPPAVGAGGARPEDAEEEVAPVLPGPERPGSGAAQPEAPGSRTPVEPVERDGPRSLREQERRLAALGRGAGPAAANALFSLGALRFDVLGDTDGAISTWEEYLRRFPDGALVAEIHLALFEALREKGRFADAVAHGQEALAGVEDDGRRRELSLGLAEILHLHLGGAERALPHYHRVIDGSDALADRAGYLLVDCLLKAGAPDRARQALEDYLRRFPAGRYRIQAEAALGGSDRSEDPVPGIGSRHDR